MIVALASSFRDKPVPGDLAAIGEVGLTGELRSVNALGQRLSEVRRLGFTKCLIPARTGGKLDARMACNSFRSATSVRRWPRFCRRRCCTAVPPWHKIDARRFRTGHAAGGCALQSAVSVLLIDTRTGAGYQAHRYHSIERVYLQLNKIKPFSSDIVPKKGAEYSAPFLYARRA